MTVRIDAANLRRCMRFLMMLAALGSASLAVAQPTREELTIYVNEVTTWSPGYAMGDIVLGSPTTAGYEPTNARRELMLRGKREGRTTLNVWDQRKSLRHELTLVVTTREAEQVQADLKKVLEAYPNVTSTRIGGQVILAGTVGSEDELATLAGIVRAARVQSTVRVARATRVPGSTGPGTTGPVTTTGTGPVATAEVEETQLISYELELFEASSQFKTGEYGRGVEPSGRSLYKGKVSAPVGGEGEIFIGGPSVDPKNKDDKAVKDTGIRLTVRPREGTKALITMVEVETNVPLEYNLYDPEVWRRSRYQFTTLDSIPFAVSGNDLLAAPAIAGGAGAMGKVTRGTNTVGRVPGVGGRGGLQYVPVFGSLFGSNNYKSRKTQILVVFRPTISSTAARP